MFQRKPNSLLGKKTWPLTSLFFFFEIYFKAPLLGDCLDIFSLLVAVVVMGFLLVGETMVDLLLLALIPSVFFVLFLSDSNRKRQLLYTFN